MTEEIQHKETFHINFFIPRPLTLRLKALSVVTEGWASQMLATAIEEYLDGSAKPPTISQTEEETTERFDPFLPQRVIHRLEKASIDHGVTPSNIVARALKGYLARNPLAQYDEG